MQKREQCLRESLQLSQRVYERGARVIERVNQAHDSVHRKLQLVQLHFHAKQSFREQAAARDMAASVHQSDLRLRKRADERWRKRVERFERDF